MRIFLKTTMGFSKIIIDLKTRRFIITEDIGLSELRNPMFRIAQRKIYSLKIHEESSNCERFEGFVIAGKEKEERLIVILKINPQYEIVTDSIFQRRVKMDEQTALYLSRALLVTLRDTKNYLFTKKVLPDLPPM